MINQQAALLKTNFAVGTVPGAQTTWTNQTNIQPKGMLVVLGMNGSGAAITSAPTAIHDQGGNVYTVQNTTVIPASGGVMWVATAPVTAGLAAGATGTIPIRGHASASPQYFTETYWVPNASGVDGVIATSGNSSAVSGTHTPRPRQTPWCSTPSARSPPPFQASPTWHRPGTTLDAGLLAYLVAVTNGAQATDLAPVTVASTLTTAAPWAAITMGLKMNLAGTGGGAVRQGRERPWLPWRLAVRRKPWLYGGGGKGGAWALHLLRRQVTAGVRLIPEAAARLPGRSRCSAARRRPKGAPGAIRPDLGSSRSSR